MVMIMKVDFMIIGAMKCGTSSLSSLLAEHPDISFSQPKEPSFFSDVPDWRSSLGQYHDLFRHKEAKIFGEGSTSYTKSLSRKVKVWEELHSYNKDLKLIYLIRHPVERAVSQYLHGYQRGFIDQPFNSALYKSELLYVGRYYFQIWPFIEQFGRDKILILKFEDFVRDHHTTLNMVSGFLGIDSAPFEGLENIYKNVMNERRVMTNQQEHKFRKYIGPIKSYLGGKAVNFIRERMIRKNEKRLKDFEFCLSDTEEEKILSFTRLDILNLQQIIPFDVSDYLVPSKNGKYRPGRIIFPFGTSGG